MYARLLRLAVHCFRTLFLQMSLKNRLQAELRYYVAVTLHNGVLEKKLALPRGRDGRKRALAATGGAG